MSIFCLNCQKETEIVDKCCQFCGERLCRVCGCSENEPCIEVCEWIKEDLCSNCVPEQEKDLGDSKIYVCLGSPSHLADLRGLLYPHESVYWTINRKAKINDKAIFYLTAPVSAVVGFGKIVEVPWEEDKSEWKEKFFSEINAIRIFDENRFITNREIRELFPEWRYMTQPRQSVLMLEAIRLPFWELMTERL